MCVVLVVCVVLVLGLFCRLVLSCGSLVLILWLSCLVLLVVGGSGGGGGGFALVFCKTKHDHSPVPTNVKRYFERQGDELVYYRDDTKMEKRGVCVCQRSL